MEHTIPLEPTDTFSVLLLTVFPLTHTSFEMILRVLTCKHTGMVKKLLNYFFVSLGVIFFFLLCVLAYVWFADPFGIRPFIDMMRANDANTIVPSMTVPAEGEAGETTEEQDATQSTDKHPALSPTQESALESVGLDPAKLPQTMTPEMEDCFTTILGEARVTQIKEGDSPTATEVFKTRSCYE